MKRFKKIIIGLAITPIVLLIIFYAYFTISMINTNSRKTVDANVVSECNEYLKNSNKDLKNVELYYQQGKIHVNIYFENNLSLDESKIVIKRLQEFILKGDINKYLTEKYMQELYIRTVVHGKDNSYYYECPYYLHTINNNSSVKNNYKIWYLTDSDGKTIETINI